MSLLVGLGNVTRLRGFERLLGNDGLDVLRS